MSEFRDEMEIYFGKRIVKILIIAAVTIGIYLLVAGVFSIWPFSSIAGVINEVTKPTAIIGNYEWFYSMKNEIDATRMKYKIAEQAKMQEAAGIKMVLQSMIAEYNAKSKMITRNLWKAQDLPYQIQTEE